MSRQLKDGEQTSAILRNYDPDVIVMDMEMPVRDRLATCRIIKNGISLNKIYPIILMGNSPDRSKIIKAVEAGCDDFIVIPFDINALLSKANQFVDFYKKNKKTGDELKPLLREQEAEVIIFSRKVIEDVFSNAMHGKLLDYPVVKNVVNKMKDILYAEKSLPMAFKMKSYNEYTYVHSINVASLCMSFAYHLKWEDRDLQFIGEGALLHDVGKTKIDLQILMKPGKLTDEEFNEIKKHPLYAKDVMAKSDIDDEILKVSLEHHERIDGNGYPNKLSNGQISNYGKLAAIVDVYDALTTDRCYHKAADSTEAIELMSKWEGQFDPELFKTFANLVNNETIGKQ